MHALRRAQAAHGTATLIKSLWARVKPTMAPFSMGRLFKAFVGAFVAPCGGIAVCQRPVNSAPTVSVASGHTMA